MSMQSLRNMMEYNSRHDDFDPPSPTKKQIHDRKFAKKGELSAGKLIKILQKVNPKLKIYSGGMFRTPRITGVNIDDDGTLCLLTAEDNTTTRKSFGKMLFDEKPLSKVVAIKKKKR